jgi:hypothetical protein
MKAPLQRIIVFTLLLAPFALAAQEVGLLYSHEVLQVEFAASEIRAAAQAKGVNVRFWIWLNFLKLHKPSELF